MRISGALQFSCYSGYAHSFAFVGDYDGHRTGSPPTICAMDALQGCAKIQFSSVSMMLRDLNKARVAFAGARTVATGHWGCGAFGNDHVLKFLQQWCAASDAGVECLYYHIYGDKRGLEEIVALAAVMERRSVGFVWAAVCSAAEECQGPGASAKFRVLMLENHVTTDNIMDDKMT